jgi:hypothetical protein
VDRMDIGGRVLGHAHVPVLPHLLRPLARRLWAELGQLVTGDVLLPPACSTRS